MDRLKQPYINPITFEAEMFVENLQTLSGKYHYLDTVLVSSLEKVTNAIEFFLNSSRNTILESECTKLLKCDNISDIKRIYHCSRCKMDLGKSVENVALHLMKQCFDYKSNNASNVKSICLNQQTNGRNSAKNKQKQIEREKKQQKSKKELKPSARIKLNKKTCRLLTTDLKNFFECHLNIADKLKCLPEYDEIQNDLSKSISPLFPDEKIKIYKFGSRLAGVASQESDLDFYIDIGNTFNIFQNRGDKNTLEKINKVGLSLKRDSDSWKGLKKVDKARVPILKVVHMSTGIECDINFSNSLGIINTNFLEYMFGLQPIARFLCIFLKNWLNRTKLVEYISSYSVILMVLFYLQTLKVLPPMQILQKNVKRDKSSSIGPWLYTYLTMTLSELSISLESTDQYNLLKFIKDFFVYYINFDFNQHVISPYLGFAVHKTKLNDFMPLGYKEYVKDNAEFSLTLDKPSVIQDPFELNHNTTKGLTAANLKEFKMYLEKSFDVIEPAV